MNGEKIIKAFENSYDFKTRYILGEAVTATVMYLDGFVDLSMLTKFVVDKIKGVSDISRAVEKGIIPFCDAERIYDEGEAINSILCGKAVLVSGDASFVFDVRKTEHRSIEQPTEESAVKASKDSLTEEMKVNITLIRKKIISAALKAERLKIGNATNTGVSVLYISGNADIKLVEGVKRIIGEANIESAVTPNVIEQILSKKLYSFFPQTVITERPDRIARLLLEGKCAVIVDGLPLAFILPATLSMFLTTSDDFSGNFIFASVIRIMRYCLIGIEVLLPGAYVAITTFHFEMIPMKLALSIASAREGVPFPVVFEMLVMLLLFEVLSEAGLHMPKSSGQAVSIVGALVVGEASIKANLVSPAAVIIVAISAICSFAMPDQGFSNALRLWRVIITVCGSMLGLFGVIAAAIVLLISLSGLEVFGIPYLAPLAGVKRIKIRDVLTVSPKGNDR